MGKRKEIFCIARDEPQARIRVTDSDFNVIKAFAAYHGRSVTAELHYIIAEVSEYRVGKHIEQISKLEDQLDRVIALAQKYKEKYGPL